jgi:pyruvate formate lyase activating enzyme
MSRHTLLAAAKIALESGGCIKFDIKAFDERMNIALCGVSNKWTLENFAFLSHFIKEREEPPFLIASTLLVPGYIVEEEIEKIATFIASLNPSIPWSLLAYSPQFIMQDLPYTKREFAYRCLEIAKRCGLKRIKIGNLHLLR